MPKRGRTRKRNWGVQDIDTPTRVANSRQETPSGRTPEDRVYFSDIEPNALLVSPYGSLAFVLWEGQECLCRVADSLLDRKRSILAPGDEVLVERLEDKPFVKAVRHRRNKLSRPAIGQNREKVFAANIDLAVVVAAAAKPYFNPGFIDRYLIAAQVGNVEPLVCLNKIDLVSQEPPQLQLYRDMGVRVVNTSCTNGDGLEELRDCLTGRISVLAGNSGVGKSSIINALDPRHELVTREISESTQRGQHTTTASRMYELRGGIRIIDTPGIRQLGLWGVVPEELDFYFHEFTDFSKSCRFRNCTHTHEPSCAVKTAVEEEMLPRARYESYLRIRRTLDENDRPTSD
ncbi:MAG: ribosome small subunit-dependent GTPase A [Candidatus Hydrogenedentes bacterium]|nr:ribosome small subunit-dependent GTPase A [Candidatus Hydrogenedentota bacterium]